LIEGIDPDLLDRDYFEGSQGESDLDERNWDMENGFVPTVTGQLSASDVDAGETDTLVWSGSGSGQYGEFTIDSDTGEWTYRLDNTRPETQALAEGHTDTDSFEVVVTDVNGAFDTITVTITVSGSNDAPVILGSSVLAGSAVEDGIASAPTNPTSPIGDFSALSGDIGDLLDAAYGDGSYAGDMAGILASVLGMPGVTDMGDAITAVWQHLDANYTAYYIDDVNEAFARLGLEYAEYLQDGGFPLSNVIAKFAPDNDSDGIPQRLQSLHDNLLGNLHDLSLADRFGASSDLYNELISLIDDLGLTGRPIYGGYEGTTNDAFAFDLAHGLLPTASGAVEAEDVDNGADLTFSADTLEGTYGTLTLDAETGQWMYHLDNGKLATQQLAEDETATDTFLITVTDEHGASAKVPVKITVTGTNDDPTLGFFQDFEAGADGVVSGGSFGGITTVPSGTAGISTPDGGDYALVTEAGTGPFTRFDGYRTQFVNGLTASIAIYLSTNWAVGEGFEYSVAASGQDGLHQRDFIFHVVKDTSSGHLLVGGSNNTNYAPREDLETIDHYEVTESGWYTLQHVFRDVGGTLVVDLNLIDGNGNIIWTETRTTTLDAIATEVGGNRYGWFTDVSVAGGVAVDKLTLGVLSASVSEITEGGAGEGTDSLTTGGVIPLKDIDVADGHSVSSAAQGSGYLGTFTAAMGDSAAGDGEGTVVWNFSVADADVEHLGEGETLVQSYLVTVNDGHGGTASQTVTVTITGTNDAPTIDNFSGTFTEADLDDLESGINLLDLGNASDVDGDAVTIVPDGADFGSVPDGIDADLTIHLDTALGDLDFDLPVEALIQAGLMSLSTDGNLSISPVLADALRYVLDANDSISVNGTLTVTDGSLTDTANITDLVLNGQGTGIEVNLEGTNYGTEAGDDQPAFLVPTFDENGGDNPSA
jgi:VCBS repeat-containing protein